MDIKNINTISFQGIKGANSHLACAKLFPKAKSIPCETFEEVFDSVRINKSNIGLIPVENSVAGRVAEIHSLMHKTPLKIVGEYFMKIELHLLGVKKIKINQIKKVKSHIHALSQCRKFIKKNKMKMIIAADTALAAREVREENNPRESAIASKLAAKTYGLEIARENVQDMKHNTTRFLIMSKNLQQKKEDNISYLTSCVFEVRSVPSALYKALGGFATHGVNLTKLESFIVEGDFNKAQFYIDIDGHIEDKSVKGALEELDFYTDKLIVLGVYPMHGYRNQ